MWGFSPEVIGTLTPPSAAGPQQYPPDKKLGWNGISNGFRAFADRDPKLDLTVIFAGNLFTGAIDLIRRDLPKMAAGEDIPDPRIPRVEPLVLPSELQRKYEGAYDLGSSAEPLTFSPDGGRYARLGDWVLIPVETDVFFSPQDYARVKLVMDDGGAVQGLKWGGDGPGPLFKRLPGGA